MTGEELFCLCGIDLSVLGIRVVGTVAAMLNNTPDAAYFMNRSENYRNVWGAQRRLMCPRRTSGEFRCQFLGNGSSKKLVILKVQ